MAEDISLRPIVLGPGGGSVNPFAGFGKGAGFGIKAKKASTAAPVTDDTVVKKDGKRIKYEKEFLMQFMERYTNCPIEVAQLGMPEIVVSGEDERDQQRQVLQKVAENLDDRDWRTRDAAGGPGADAPQGRAEEREGANWEKLKERTAPESGATDSKENKQPAQTAAPAAAQTSEQAKPANPDQLPKVIRAADVGLQAYKPGAQLSTEERAQRTIKGILNKLTPEKFERLLQQLLEVITTADLLKHTISLVFENAVEQPTYCAMYADLCLRLSKELPSFPPPGNSGKPITFRQILLNTCQDEFEGTETARENLTKVTDPTEREQAERTVKKRTLGNMRLISELYKQNMVKDWIMTQCMEDLLNAPKGKVPPEDNIEAACEMITTAGGRLSKSERPETRKALDEVLKRLETIGSDTRNVAARIRFVIKDILDLKRSNWIPRREVFTAKKLDEVRAQAEAELGLISSSIAAALPTLPSQQRLGPILGVGPSAGDDIPLIPPLRSGAGAGDSEGWGLFPPLRSEQNAGPAANGGMASALLESSALLGAGVAAAGAPAAKAQPAQPAAAAAPVSQKDEDALKNKTDGLFQEYLSTLDKKEAVLCVQELQSPGWMSRLVEQGIDTILNSTREKDQQALMALLLHLHQQGLVTSDDIAKALETYTAMLEDLSMDFPKGPAQLGQFIGQAVTANALPLSTLTTLLNASEFGAEAKRDLAAALFKTLQGDVAAQCKAAGLKLGELLKVDAEENPDAPSVEAWLSSAGLAGLPL